MGTIIFFMMTGSYPFEGKHPLQVMENIKKGVYSFPPDVKISKCCMSLIKGLLQVNPERRMTFEEFFKHPFVQADPVTYLAQLRSVWGPNYGAKDPLRVPEKAEPEAIPQASPPRHYEKSELLPPAPVLKSPAEPIDVDFEIVEPEEASSEKAPVAPLPAAAPTKEVEPYNPFLEDAMKDDEQTPATKNSFNAFEDYKMECDKILDADYGDAVAKYKEVAKKLLEQAAAARVLIQQHSVMNAYDNIKFVILVRVLKQIKDLFCAGKGYTVKRKQYAIAFAEKLRKKIIRLPIFDTDPEMTHSRTELGKTYQELVEDLKNFAFVLPDIHKMKMQQEGFGFSLKLAKRGAKMEKVKQLKDAVENYKASLLVIDLLLDECYISLAKADAVIPMEYFKVIELIESAPQVKCRTIMGAPNMKFVKNILMVRKLVRERMKRVSKRSGSATTTV